MTFTGLWPVALLLLCNLDFVAPAGNYEHYKAAVLAHSRVDSQAAVQERSKEGQEPPTVVQLHQMIEAAYNYVLGKSSAYAQALEATGHLHHYSGGDFSKLLQSLKAKLEKGRKAFEEMQQVYWTCINDSKLGPDEPMPAQFMPKYVNFHQNVYWNSWLDWFVRLAARQRFNNKIRAKIVSYESEIVKDTKSLNKLKKEAQAWERSLGQAFGILTSNLKVMKHYQINDLRNFDRKFSKSWVTINGLLNVLDETQGKVKQVWSANQNGHEGLESDPENVFGNQKPPGQDLVLARIQAPTKPNKIKVLKYFLQNKFFYIPAIVAGVGIPVGLQYDLYNKFLGLIGWNSEVSNSSRITASIEMSSNNGASPSIMPSSTNPPRKLPVYLTVSALVILALLIAGCIALSVKRQTGSDDLKGRDKRDNTSSSTFGATQVT